MAGAYRCSNCAVNWPAVYHDFGEKCCVCRQAVAWMGNAEPDMDVKEARSRQRHADFERYWAEREARRDAEFAAITDGVQLEEPETDAAAD